MSWALYLTQQKRKQQNKRPSKYVFIQDFTGDSFETGYINQIGYISKMMNRKRNDIQKNNQSFAAMLDANTTSSPEIANQLLEVMSPPTELPLAGGANLKIKFEV